MTTITQIAATAAEAGFADTVAITTAACVTVGGALGFVAESHTPREMLDNMALGAGVGTFFGAVSGTVIYLVSAVAGG